MGLLHHYLLNEITALHAKGVRLSVIGDYRRLAPDLVRLLEYGMEMTAANNRLTLVLALNYGGQDEMVRVVRMLASDVQSGKIRADAIGMADIEADRKSTRLSSH